MDNLAQDFRETLVSRKLVEPKDRLLIAVSGGVDSMVLLDLLQRLAGEYRLRLVIAHLNHGLRGRSSDADARLVQRSAGRLVIPFATRKADVRGIAKRQGISIEMAARQARHEFLLATARRFRVRKIVMAHHADDQVELFFIRLFRGAGLEGLAGMKWNAPFPGDGKIRIIRPLLEIPKTALREYANEQGIAFREDATNASLNIQRNRIRNELLPLLRLKYQPNVAETILRTVDLVRDESEWATSAARDWLANVKGKSTDFGRLPVALQRHCVRLQLRDLGIEGDYSLVERLRLKPGTPTTAPCGAKGRKLQVTLDAQSGVIGTQVVDLALFKTGRRKTLTVDKSGSERFGKVEFSWSILDWVGGKLPRPSVGVEHFDADKVGEKVVLRTWQAGDRFRPIGMRSATKLQDFFINQKVPRRRRHELMLGITEGNEIFWVEGMRIGESFKLTDKTIRCLQWRWKRL